MAAEEGAIARGIASVASGGRRDEDVPGGATAYLLQQILERQGGFWQLDAAPRTITAKARRPPCGSDGDDFAEPNRETVFDAVWERLHEVDPRHSPTLDEQGPPFFARSAGASAGRLAGATPGEIQKPEVPGQVPAVQHLTQ
ncbi:MAG: hypothetical protein IPJ17_18360 [Holophagales bacterium]|nr:MAG: hypothetical protein IPJ17_18360 [Holophagales bacterium]